MALALPPDRPDLAAEAVAAAALVLVAGVNPHELARRLPGRQTERLALLGRRLLLVYRHHGLGPSLTLDILSQSALGLSSGMRLTISSTYRPIDGIRPDRESAASIRF